MSWFPREELAVARRRWPQLDDDLADADAYCRGLELRLRELAETIGRRPLIAPLRVNELIRHADEEGLDAGHASVRADLAAELHRRGETIAWPPGRNEPCWCRSGRKYKRCCGA